MGEPIKAIEVCRAGDVFLGSIRCPYCGTELLSSLKYIKCDRCHYENTSPSLDLSVATKRNIVACDDKNNRKKISLKTARLLQSLQENTCGYCSCTLTDKHPHIDHVMPLAVGGTNNVDNLVLSCPSCNLTASSKYFATSELKRSYILKHRFK